MRGPEVVGTDKEGDWAFPPKTRSKIDAHRRTHLRSGVVLLILGSVVGTLVPFLWTSSNDVGKGAMLGGAFLLAAIGGWNLGMATYGWILTKARIGSDYFPTTHGPSS